MRRLARIRSEIVSESQPNVRRINGSRHRVAVVFGGTSSEHGVSCLTAAGVLSALDRERFDVVGIGITRTGRWILVDSETIGRLGVTDGRLPELSENAAEAMLMRVSSGSELAVREQSVLSHLGPVDVALALLHGPFGEDGTIQGLFEMMGTRYVGAGVLASAVGMDKHYLKLVLAASGLPIGPFVAITAAEWRRDPRVLHSSSPNHTAARGIHDYVTDLLFNEIRPETLVAFARHACRSRLGTYCCRDRGISERLGRSGGRDERVGQVYGADRRRR